ncbi:ABC transporter permease [Mesorhizobium sp. BAC0120]|uniref:ABC transporter permease n=1 Tax=Mesorhizobium sp. BAC0120 TaxID=3090670 RepID=UPI00298C5A30|nr:ABC transporter permease [Mesorhizobium sp. BAC0120]MDW6023538.1 ABC transporter permease [Mesorhizobium sp. BAC0120]
MTSMLELLTDPALFATVLRVMTPLLLAALGVLISDRAGVFNIGMEGMMLSGALSGVLVSAWIGSAWLGLLAAVLLCAAIGALMAIIVNKLGAHLIITGIALNLAASAATTLGLFFATGDKGMSGSLKSGVLPSIRLPVIDQIPVLGTLLSGHHVLTYLALLAVPVVSLLVWRTPFGLHLRAVGVDAKSAAAAGIRVARVQMLALMLSGVFGGLAGAYLSMGYVSWFAQNMTAGRGFIAIAVEVMGAASAWGTLAAAVVIAIAETLAITMQSLGLPNELMQMIPYVVPIVVLTFWASRRRALARIAQLS